MEVAVFVVDAAVVAAVVVDVADYDFVVVDAVDYTGAGDFAGVVEEFRLNISS